MRTNLECKRDEQVRYLTSRPRYGYRGLCGPTSARLHSVQRDLMQRAHGVAPTIRAECKLRVDHLRIFVRIVEAFDGRL